jgi:hypothetical protein
VRAWARWAGAAALVRLARLRFAASSDGRVVVHGAPLPPLDGRRFTQTEGVAVPCGLAWSPPVGGPVLRELLGLREGDLALFEPGGTYELIEASAFVPASRSAARRTLEGQGHG